MVHMTGSLYPSGLASLPARQVIKWISNYLHWSFPQSFNEVPHISSADLGQMWAHVQQKHSKTQHVPRLLVLGKCQVQLSVKRRLLSTVPFSAGKNVLTCLLLRPSIFKHHDIHAYISLRAKPHLGIRPAFLHFSFFFFLHPLLIAYSHLQYN